MKICLNYIYSQKKFENNFKREIYFYNTVKDRKLNFNQILKLHYDAFLYCNYTND